MVKNYCAGPRYWRREMIDDASERRRYYPDEENVPLSAAIQEAIRAHEESSVLTDDLDLYDHLDLEAIDTLFRGSSDVEISVQFRLPTATVSV